MAWSCRRRVLAPKRFNFERRDNYPGTGGNLDQLNKAFKDWLNIDVRRIFFKKKRIGKSIAFLENRISEIIQYRHGIVHHFAIDRSLTKDAYIHILDALSLAIEEFVLFIEIKYKIDIDRT